MKQVRIDLIEQDIGGNTDKSTRLTFGICVTVEYEDGHIKSQMYPDISYSKSKVEKFISMLVRNDVSPVHIEDMIDDYFYSA
ncbi:MAG: hypothetical protein IJF40_04195 [Clostridia bacterium]|nr:hypothetical protein [Clostridia bacterium]